MAEKMGKNSREIKLYRFAIERSSGELSKAGEAQNQQNTTENNENQQKETREESLQPDRMIEVLRLSR